MFGIARVLVRNKVLVVGVLAVGVFLASGSREETKPANPWSSAPAPQAASSDAEGTSFTDKAFKAADSAAKMAGVEEFSPSALKDQTVGNLDKTNSAMAGVGKGGE
jgi:hypothetical protein